MALGAMTAVESYQVGQGPVFMDRVTLVGDGAYPAGGSTGLKAKLRALTKDNRAPFAVIVEDGKGFVVQYDVLNDKTLIYEQDAGGALAETATANQSGVTYKLCVLSK